jgi:hypothetical protein
METTKFYTEYRLQSKPNVWNKVVARPFDKLIEAEADIKACLERQKENGDLNYLIHKDRVLEYRVVEVSTKTKETILSGFLVESKDRIIKAKKDELYYLNQVYKYLKHLEHLYNTGKISDEGKSFQIKVSLNNTQAQINTLSDELENLTGGHYKHI